MARFLSIIIALTVAALTATPTDAQVYTDPNKVDADYAIQGEYVGDVEGLDGDTAKFGVQIVAQGDGEFLGVGYPGGLPGQGFVGDKEKIIRVKAQKVDGGLKFQGEDGYGIYKDGAVTIYDNDGQLGGVLKKVERKSKTLGMKPPKGAVVLFDGTTADNFKNGKMTDDNLLMQGVTSKQLFQDHRVHVEFRLPYMPKARGQGRGNSGIYVQGRYEVQMLDSFGLVGAMNECGGIYSVTDCPVNLCLPPLTWQTYDIYYTATRYDDDGKVKSNPRVTVFHNGMLLHDDQELPGDRNTTAAPLKAGPEPGPVYLQNHGNPVVYRNIWVVESAKRD